MAHTERYANDKKRPHFAAVPLTKKVGLYMNGKLRTGKVSRMDDGGWIYVAWDYVEGEQTYPPGYLRSTQVFEV